ncbi:hypothetical protein MVES1_003132 [Malassezia vespertilionis]|uniref:uncharacterized protein n=1 Tax=Malassezia vespertilionis TaxID=2020962 RepID=UPI0024B058D1|nr:uncharacterized protein MVES1_003132 [Malassezia vespertilionis]WFD07761.1 hypothetical protein MVES1_003132 [Malassezia vespertilionis]
MSDQDEKVNVLFCCLGNICRSPMAEAVFSEHVKRNGAADKFGVIDSCGTADYHVGEEPHETTVAVCKEHDIPVKHLARAIRRGDFSTFDYIFGMEYVSDLPLMYSSNNVKNLRRMQPPGTKAKVLLFSEFDDKATVCDPYYVRATRHDAFPDTTNMWQIGNHAFYTVFEQCVRYTNAFLAAHKMAALPAQL